MGMKMLVKVAAQHIRNDVRRQRIVRTSALHLSVMMSAFLLGPLKTLSAQTQCALPGVPPVIESGAGLLVPLANGDTVELSYVLEGTDVTYSYRGFLETIGHHVIRSSYWMGEGWSHILIDHCTGTRTIMKEMPAVSPDGLRLAMASVDLVAEFAPTVLEVWVRNNSGFILEWSYEPMKQRPETNPNWGPRAPRWLNSSSVEFEMVDMDGDVLGVGMAELTDSGWTIGF